MIPLSWFLVLSAILFCIGLYAVITRKNTIAILVTDHGRVRAFRSPLNGAPGNNRMRALEIAGRLSDMTGKPVESVVK